MKKLLLFAFLALFLNANAQINPVHSIPKDPGKNSAYQFRGGQSELTLKLNEMFKDNDLAKELKHPSGEFRGLVQRYDSIYSWLWDTTFYNWALNFKFIDLLYNADVFPTSLTGQIWNGTAWVNNFQIQYTYNANNYETSNLYRTWSGSAWVNSFQTLYTYDGNGNETSEVSQIWTGSTWMNSSLYAYTYDGNNNLVNETDSYWSGVTWEFAGRYVYSYDPNNNQITAVHQTFDAVNIVWNNSDQFLYAYDGNNNQTSSTYQTWNGVSWDNGSLVMSTYDSHHNVLTTMNQYWDGTQWVNVDETTNTYNANNLLLTSLTKNWNGSNYDNASSVSNQYNGSLLTKSLTEIWNGTTWKYSSLDLYTYGENNFIQSQSNRTYDGDQNLVTDGDSTLYYFKSVSGTHDLHIEDGNLQVSPNPNHGKFTLTSNSGMGKIEVFNFLGERVYADHNVNGQTRSDINLGCNAAGLYVLIMTDGTKVSSQKILIQ